jgi:hypothetical protein
MVVTIEACPINSLIFTTSTPASANRVPNVWRKSWNLKSVILASRQAAEKDFLTSVYRSTRDARHVSLVALFALERKLKGATAHGRSISSEEILESRREMWGDYMREDET